jgi:DivIVA domain-containing protein
MELSSRQIQDRDFGTALRGYNRDEVDGFMNECAALTSALEERTRTAEVRSASSERELAAQTANIDVLLQEATDARRKIIEEARVEANSIAGQVAAANGSQESADAASTAAAIINEAEAAAHLRMEEVELIRESAREDAQAIIRRAEQSAAVTQAEADRLLDKARLDASSVREEAEATQAAVEAQLAEIKDLLDAARAGEGNAELVIDLRDRVNKQQSYHASG